MTDGRVKEFRLFSLGEPFQQNLTFVSKAGAYLKNQRWPYPQILVYAENVTGDTHILPSKTTGKKFCNIDTRPIFAF